MTSFARRPRFLTAWWFRWAAWLFAIAVVVHNVDHARRGVGGLQAEVVWAGSAAIIVEVAAVALVAGGHQLAPLATMSAGFPLAAGYALVHFTPQRSWFSDSLLDGAPVDAWTWAAAGLETIAALALGIAGMVMLVRSGGASALAAPMRFVDDQWWRGLRHPAVATFAVTNVAIIASTLPSL